MVEKREFAVIFRTERNDTYEQLIPYDVVEGTYHKEINGFIVQEDILYKHITYEENPFAVSYGYRITIEDTNNSLSENSVKQITNDMLDYAKNYTYIRIKDMNIMVMDNETEELSPFEDLDTRDTNEIKKAENHSQNLPKFDMKPEEIVKKVTKTIKGQEEAIIKIVTTLWINLNYLNISKKNMLIVGPTGVGKTAIFEKLQKIINIPLTIFPIPGLSQAGYSGRSTDDILRKIYIDNNGDIERAENSIVILDEIDKLAFNNNNDGSISTIGVQNELLKMMEGCEINFKISEMEYPITIDTTNIIFVGTGAFQELYEQKNKIIGYGNKENENSRPKINADNLQKYGFKREFIARMPVTVELKELTKEIFKEIILTSDESEVTAYIDALKSEGIEVTNIDETIDAIIDDAINKKIGARGFASTANNIFSKIFYDVGNNPNKYNELIIGKNILDDPSDFHLVETKSKKRIKVKGSEV